MPNFTPNLNLKKPLTTEYYNIADFNDNMDIIDTDVQAIIDDTPANLFDIYCGAQTGSVIIAESLSEISSGNITGVYKSFTLPKGGYYTITFEAKSTGTPAGINIRQDASSTYPIAPATALPGDNIYREYSVNLSRPISPNGTIVVQTNGQSGSVAYVKNVRVRADSALESFFPAPVVL